MRVHNDARADSLNRTLNARAFTAGQNIFFKQGEYNPSSSSGRKILAHELTHVLQQTGAKLQRQSSDVKYGNKFAQKPGEINQWMIQRMAQIVQQKADEGLIQCQVEDDDKEKEIQTRMIDDSIQRQIEMEGEDLRESDLIRTEKNYTSSTSSNEKNIVQLKLFNTRSVGAKPADNEEDLVKQWISRGITNATILTNRVFFRRKSEIDPKTRLKPGSPEAKEWIEIRNNVIRPLLKLTKKTEFTWLSTLSAIYSYLGKFVLLPGLDRSESNEGKAIPSTKDDALPSIPSRSNYEIIVGKNFHTILDGKPINKGLLNKMKRMANYALENDIVSGNVWFTSGMRSLRKAHKWSTAYQIRQGNVSMKKLKELTNSRGEIGRDEDNNVWYQPGWTKKQVLKNAKRAWIGALAAEGYGKGTKEREPNTFKGGVTRHATGLAIDAVFPWKDKGKVKDPAALDNLKNRIKKKYAKRPKKLSAALAKIDKFVARGSYSDLAKKVVSKFGLTRPVLHSKTTEDWHYEMGKG